MQNVFRLRAFFSMVREQKSPRVGQSRRPARSMQSRETETKVAMAMGKSPPLDTLNVRRRDRVAIYIYLRNFVRAERALARCVHGMRAVHKETVPYCSIATWCTRVYKNGTRLNLYEMHGFAICIVVKKLCFDVLSCAKTLPNEKWMIENGEIWQRGTFKPVFFFFLCFFISSCSVFVCYFQESFFLCGSAGCMNERSSI